MTTPNQMDKGASSPALRLYDHAYDRLIAKDYDRGDCQDPQAKSVACFSRGESRVTISINREDEVVIEQFGAHTKSVFTKVSSIEQIDAIL